MLVLSPPQNVSGDFMIFRDFIPSIWFYCPYHHCKKELTLLTCTLLARIQYTTTRSVESLEFMVAPFLCGFCGYLPGISISNESWDSLHSLYIQHYIPTDPLKHWQPLKLAQTVADNSKVMHLFLYLKLDFIIIFLLRTESAGLKNRESA